MDPDSGVHPSSANHWLGDFVRVTYGRALVFSLEKWAISTCQGDRENYIRIYMGKCPAWDGSDLGFASFALSGAPTFFDCHCLLWFGPSLTSSLTPVLTQPSSPLPPPTKTSSACHPAHPANVC